MNLQQIRYLCAVVDHGLNVSVAAEALFTSQPGISKQIRQLEEELGVPIFVRQGKRLSALTAGGEVIVATARRALQELNNLKRVGAEFRAEDDGTLAIATTHTQARYVLPPVLKRFAEKYPRVRLLLHQGNPLQVAEQTARAEVDVGIATEALADFPELVTLPCYYVESLRAGAQGSPAGPGEAADARGARPLSDRHLRLQLHRPVADQRGVFRQGARPERRPHRARLRRHQDLRRARPRRRHRGADGLRPGARAPVRKTRRESPVRCRARPGSRCDAACTCAASSTNSSRCSPRNSTARRSKRRSRAPPSNTSSSSRMP